MRNQKVQASSSLNSLKDLIVNNPRIKERVSYKETERDVKESERGGNKNKSNVWEV